MNVTFPHMGHLDIILRALFRGLGLEVSPPPPVTKRTLELGAQYAPETVCLPFKLTLGNFIESLEQGAQTIITCGGVGPCRLGYYAEVQKGILRELGYHFEMIAIEPDIAHVFGNLRRLAARRTWPEIYAAFKLAGAKMEAIDTVEAKVRYLRPRVAQKRAADRIWEQFLREVDQAECRQALKACQAKAERELDALDRRETPEPLKIGIVGEIYVMLEPFVNQQLDLRLGEMGVEVHKAMSLTEYVRVHLLRNKQYLRGYREILKLAEPFLAHYVGGHGIKSIGCTIDMRHRGLDGIIQVFPFTCMPEVIAKNILPTVAASVNMPVLSLAFDEQSGEAGMMTRVEAFIDLLYFRRMRQCR
ncbi:MAG: hypothetical protein N2491_04750 [Negativicutes bacterium]|nr:hypothetical protein [Negativicutes bacterium]